MKKRFYKCILLSDIVLNPGSATEGSFKSLDYIPGTNFLGIVAKNYDEFKKQNKHIDVFHSGKVQFGDAHLAIKNKRSLKKPAEWFYRKIDKNKEDKEIFLYHFIDGNKWEDMIKKGIQLKQERTGYFILNGNTISLPEILHDFSIKSAYDPEKRRAKDSMMYGYDVLKVGNEFIFSIRVDDENLFSEIEKYLLGEKNIGRSKTAQYGRVKIEKLTTYEQPTYFDNDFKGALILYFESCAAFLDENGYPTFQPDIKKDLMLNVGKIDWGKSQILTRTFSLWNATRKTRDFDRICIDKGSVIFIKEMPNDFDLQEYKEKIENGIGIYKNEGFGRILVNPIFLTKKRNEHILDFTFEKMKTENKQINFDIYFMENDSSDNDIMSFVESESEKQKNLKTILKYTNEFIAHSGKKFSKISNSQWGMVRQIAMRNTNFEKMMEELFRDTVKDDNGNKIDDGGFLRHGKSEKYWRNLWKVLKNKIEEVKKFTDEQYARKFLINLCAEMQKRNNLKEGKNGDR